MMTTDRLIALSPFLVVAASAVVLMLLIAWRRNHHLSAWTCVAGLALGFACLSLASANAPSSVTPLLIIDRYAVYYVGLILLGSLAVAFLSISYFDARADTPREEYYLLLLLATLGAAVMAASNHFAALLLGLETLSISLLGLIAYRQGLERPLEASVKYLVLSGVASAFLLFGIAIIYDELGTLAFVGPAWNQAGLENAFWLTGVAMVLTGLGFKLSVVPFHMWAPDVYEGGPAPVTAFIAAISKTAALSLLLRYFLVTGALQAKPLLAALSVLAVLSMIGGNLLALLQDNVKRMLAYSSIGHLGYLLVAVIAGGPLAIEAVSIYLLAYAVTMLGALGIVSIVSTASAPGEADRIEDYRGLVWTRPWLAVAFSTLLLSLAGIPLTAGFIAKFYAVIAGVGAGLAVPIIALVLGSVIGLYYYLRLIVAMLAPLSTAAITPAPGPTDWSARATVVVLLLVLVGLGAYPAPFLALVRATAVELANGLEASGGIVGLIR
jgi:NADH-quinone oxidoreductase subunit N